MADQNNANELERLCDLLAEAVEEYEALSDDYWRKRKLLNVLRTIAWVALTVAVIVWIASIFVGSAALVIVALVCNVCWIVLDATADDIELSALRQWRLAMIRCVGWNMIDD